jgi:hypothetical protein
MGEQVVGRACQECGLMESMCGCGKVIQVIVRPEDNRCEGCREELGEDIYETDDMVVLCKACFDNCVEEGGQDAGE